MSAIKKLPLRQNGEIVGFAVVDADDYERLSRYRWTLMKNGYVVRKAWKKSILLHREIMGLEVGDRREVDHINQNKIDNRRVNLRIVSRAENARNRGANSDSTSRYLGVSWDKTRGKWTASACLDGKRINLGRFEDEHQAALAAALWRRKHTPYVHGLAA